MIDFILKYWLQVAFGIMVGCFTYVVKELKEERKKRKALEQGVQALLRNEIVGSYNKWSERGFCPIYAKENVKRMYDAYHTLGGNDIATKLKDELIDLPTENDSEKN